MGKSNSRKSHHRALWRVAALSVVGVMVNVAFVLPSLAADKIRVGKAASVGFSFSVLDVGMAEGFYRDAGIEIEEFGFNGAARAEQGIVAGAIDIALSAGTDMALLAKGVPAMCVAVLAGSPYDIAIIVSGKSPIKTLDDLKGKRLSASTAGGSMMEWMGQELTRVKGWGPNAVTTVAVGVDRPAKAAALKTDAVDAVFDAPGMAFELEKDGSGRLLALASDYVKDFMVHGIYASNAFIAEHPDALRRFLAAWFKTIQFMHANRDESVRIIAQAIGADVATEGREYDLEMPMFSTDGRFSPAAMAKLDSSFVSAGTLDSSVDLAKFYTEKYLPAAP
jgi:ABC-type nitrate/sulfonate/bicarbonate transport system substrate-binding protein